MTGSQALDPPLPDLAAIEPVANLRRRWPVVLATLLTAAMVIGLGVELFGSGLAGLRRAVPESPLFYVFFVLLYFTLPLADLAIFRGLWRIPFVSGFVALNKKRVANDVLIGYSGEAYFYAWARARSQIVAAPFGAVKDVSILSAIAGNALTIILCAIALPLGHQLIASPTLQMISWSISITVVSSAAFLLFSRRVFSLDRASLWFIFDIHCARILATSVFLALAWHFAMPDVSISMWLFLVAGRQLTTRLPFVPNKDLLFANFAILVIGHDRTLSETIAFTAASSLVMHLLLIAGFGIGALWERTMVWRRR